MNKNHLTAPRACPSLKVLTSQEPILSQTLVGPSWEGQDQARAFPSPQRAEVIKEFLAHVAHLVAVAPVVYLGAFHHGERYVPTGES